MRHTRLQKLGLYLDSVANVPLFIAITCLLVFFLYYKGHEKDAMLFLASAGFLMVVIGTLKILTNTSRPKNSLVDIPWPAFPSGHSAVSAFLSISIPYFALPKSEVLAVSLGIVGVLATSLVSLNRLVIRVHTRTQVIAGILLGTFVSSSLILFHNELISLIP